MASVNVVKKCKMLNNANALIINKCSQLNGFYD